ncbi:MAG: FAD-dependent oxidoreductase [Actinomycetota bacterium]
MSTDRVIGTVVVGAGPTGLGAAHRLHEVGDRDWLVLEGDARVGGLAKSHVDPAGFTWDVGGHVMFSQSPYYNALCDRILADESLMHVRESWIWTHGRYVPYPFQNNVSELPLDAAVDCIDGLYRAAAARRPGPGPAPASFADWIRDTFGDGISRHFMDPYNRKVWATPLERMSASWIAERVAVVEPRRILELALAGRQDATWGPNATFRYPTHGGTGGMWEKVAAPLRHGIRTGAPVVAIDPAARRVTLAGGGTVGYRRLVTTMPLDTLCRITAGCPYPVRAAADGLTRNRGVMIGIGVERGRVSDKNWVYFPEEDVPFYRLTFLSNYSPHIVPGADVDRYSALLMEVSVSEHRPADEATLADRCVDALVRAGILQDADRRRIASVWQLAIPYSYPVPTVDRDRRLAQVEGWLASVGITSAGRFGAWRYEVGNMDHSFMMGVNAVEGLLDMRLSA